VARPSDLSQLLAKGRAKVDRDRGKRSGRSFEALLAVAARRGSHRNRDAAKVEAKLSTARARFRPGTVRD